MTVPNWWLVCRTRMPQKKFVATGILIFDFELFVGERYQSVSGCKGKGHADRANPLLYRVYDVIDTPA